MCMSSSTTCATSTFTPQIAPNTTNLSSASDARTTRHPGYAISQQKRKRTEEPFGWGKTIGGLARPMLRGAARLRFKFTFTMAAYDLIRGGSLVRWFAYRTLWNISAGSLRLGA